MCNKCEVREPAVVAKWNEYVSRFSSGDFARREFRAWLRFNMRGDEAHQPPSLFINHPERRSTMRQFGKDLAVAHARAQKLATRDTANPQDLSDIATYIVMLDRYTSARKKMEPTIDSIVHKVRSGEWEMLHPIKNLHPLCDGITTAQEQSRYTDSYRAFDQINQLHFLHVSVDDINQIAYYPTLNHMRTGREVRTRLGRYLTKYQEALKLSDSDIKSMTEKHTANMRGRGGWEVKFIEHDDVDGWLRVYDSPDVSSCMKGSDAVRVYAHEKSVLRLAYVQAGQKIVARCIVRDDEPNKGWLRVYPDHNGYAEGRFLLDYLKVNGYQEQTNLDGALLQHIYERGQIVCPYLDYGDNGDQTVSETSRDGVAYLVCGGGDYSATCTDGTVEETCSCAICGDRMSEDDSNWIEYDDLSVCEYCRDERYTYAWGARYEDYFPADECIEVGGTWYFKDTIDQHYDEVGYCDIDEEYYKHDDLVNTQDGTFHERHVIYIDHEDCDGNNYCLRDKVHTLSDGTTCHEDDAERYEAELTEATA